MIIQKMIVLLLSLVFLNCQQIEKSALEKEYSHKIEITLKNSTNTSRLDELISIEIANLVLQNESFNKNAFVVVEGKKEIPSQLKNENIVFVTDFSENETKQLEILFSEKPKDPRQYQKRAHAEISFRSGGKFEGKEYIGGDFASYASLQVPEQHVAHDGFIRYEGPGWESDKVGFRYYLDSRNAIDIFGKKTKDMILHHVDQDTSGSYHEMQFWGMDVFKVGNSLGLGSIGTWDGNKVEMVSTVGSILCTITDDGPITANVHTIYKEWKSAKNVINLESNLSISAGKRYTRHDLQIDGSIDNLCTGIIKNENGEVLKSEKPNGWQYLALYGKQSLANDSLGVAIFFNSANLQEIVEDDQSHVIVLIPENGNLSYYFAAAWEQEKDGLKTKNQFITWLNSELEKFNNPIQLSFKEL